MKSEKHDKRKRLEFPMLVSHLSGAFRLPRDKGYAYGSYYNCVFSTMLLWYMIIYQNLVEETLLTMGIRIFSSFH